jgi:hypothetical protein
VCLAVVAVLGCGGRVATTDDCSPCSPPEDATTPLDATLDASQPPAPDDATLGDVDASDAEAIVDAGSDVGSCGVDRHLSHGVCLADDAAADLPSIDACLDAGNVLWVDGDPGAYIYAGASDLVGGWWAVSTESYGAPENGVLLEAHYANSTWSDPWWFLLFRDATTLATGVVYHANSAQSTQPGLEIQYGSLGCYAGGEKQYYNTGEGAFRIDDFDASDGSLRTFNTSFWILCDKASGVLRGCVQYSQ